MEFNTGVTAVVGPNGSGKSNISDAVRWVLGEMSPKSLRGSKMEDVIFSGTAKRSPTGYCEVSLIMDNHDRTLAVDTDEVKITRKYFRSGDSEYKINEKTSRLKDIYELFLNTGIGREGYSVVGQGKIAEVISQKSEERRHIFEEAAGISKFRYRKNDATKKLAETDANLVRVTDIATEIGSRIGTLEKEAENAKKYLVLAARKKELEVSLWFDRITKAGAESEKYAEKTETARKHYEEKELELFRSEQRTAEIAEKRQTAVEESEQAREALAKSEAEKNELESLRSLSQNDIAHHEATRTALAEQITKYETETLPRLKRDVEAEETAKAEAEAQHEKAKAEETALEARLTEAKTALSDAQTRAEDAESGARRADEALTNAKIGEASARNAEQSENAQREFIDSEIAKAKTEQSEAQTLLDAANVRKGKIEEERKELADELAAEKKSLEGQTALFEEKLREKNERSALLSADIHRKEVLERMDRLLEGYPNSVKTVVNEPTLTGICGPVSRIVTAQEAYVTAIETALGAAVSNIVVEDEQAAKDAIRYLKEHNAGRATFLPLTSVRANPLSQPGLATEAGYIGLASELVSCEGRYAVVADYLLGRTAMADNIDSASRIARKYGYKFRIVTLDGQLINAGGSYTGGSTLAKSGIMSRTADIEKLEKQIRAHREALGALENDRRKAQEAILEARDFIEGLENDLSNVESALYKTEGDIRLYTERIAACAERIEKTQAQLDEYTAEGAGERLRKLADELAAAQAAKDAAMAAFAARTAEKEQAEDALTSVTEQLANARLVSLGREKDVAAAEERLQAALLRRTESENALASLRAQDEDLCRKLENVRAIVEGGEEKIAAAKERIDACRATLEERIALATDLERELTAIRSSERELMNDKESFFKELTRCESILENSRNTYDTLTAKLFEEYELTYTEAGEMDLPAPTPETGAELASVKGKIRALGNVNVGAVEEYKETKERYDFLTAQIGDLQESRKSLENVIARLEKDMKAMFSKSMVEINESFKQVFAELFGGGSAEIVITEPDNILESGIEINVQPPGKMVKSLSLLSGGEQAFTAIALYFAILKVNPAPFYIFDEIEAALDDINVARFGRYLKKNSKNTQFIVITHRRGTMETAETLYGVTMQEKGVSNFLRVNIEDVEKKTGVKLTER